MIRRGLQAGLIGKGCRIIWAVADNGWIFEGRRTNVATNEYHGYPDKRFRGDCRTGISEVFRLGKGTRHDPRPTGR